QPVERQMTEDERKMLGVRKERALSVDGDHERIGDDTGEDGGDQGIGFEAVSVQDLGRQESGAEWRAKDGGDSGGDPGDQQNAPLARADLEPASNERSQGAANLHGRSLASARAARAERDQ